MGGGGYKQQLYFSKFWRLTSKIKVLVGAPLVVRRRRLLTVPSQGGRAAFNQGLNPIHEGTTLMT